MWWRVQDDGNRDESEHGHDGVDRMKKEADSTDKVMHV